MPFSRDANTVWKALNGIICVYKPLDYTSNKLRHSLIVNICRDLNELDSSEPTPYISINAPKSTDIVTSETKLSVRVTPSYVNNVNVTGPSFIPKDIRCNWNKFFGVNTSGVFLLGINDGLQKIGKMAQEHSMRTFHITGRLGRATDTGWAHKGKSIMKANFSHVPREAIDRILAATQAAHQRQAFEFARIDPQSQEAFELAKTEGIIKPNKSSGTLLFQARCIKFEPPDFTIEVQSVNEREQFLVEFVGEIGRRVRSVAACVSIRCVKDGPFLIEHALSKSEWNLPRIMSNMKLCTQIFDEEYGRKKYIDAL